MLIGEGNIQRLVIALLLEKIAKRGSAYQVGGVLAACRRAHARAKHFFSAAWFHTPNWTVCGSIITTASAQRCGDA